ncbi:MAG: hypothetical protein AB7O92_15325 [Acidimicrobiia bacterium]
MAVAGWSGARRLVGLAAWVAAGVVLMAAVGSVAIWIYAGPARAVATHQLRIPAGAADDIAAGGNPLELPATWELTSGDLLVIDNGDAVTHTFGSWAVPAGAHLETVLRPNLGPLLCTLHPSGQITLDVRPARTDWTLALRAALLLGIPMGLVGWVVNRIRHALEDPPTADAVTHLEAPVPLTSATGGLR